MATKRSRPWHSYSDSMIITDELYRMLKWLRRFKPTGNQLRDIGRFLMATGGEEVLEKTQSVDGNLVTLARSILSNHEEELDRIREGRVSRWFPSDADRVPLYTECLERQAAVLRQILAEGSPRERAA